MSSSLLLGRHHTSRNQYPVAPFPLPSPCKRMMPAGGISSILDVSLRYNVSPLLRELRGSPKQAKEVEHLPNLDAKCRCHAMHINIMSSLFTHARSSHTVPGLSRIVEKQRAHHIQASVVVKIEFKNRKALALSRRVRTSPGWHARKLVCADRESKGINAHGKPH